MNRASRKRLIGVFKDDRGAAALVIAAVIAIIAFTALEIYLNNFIGSRDLARAQSATSTQGHLVDAVFTYYLKNSGTGTAGTLPCPDPDLTPTGAAGGAAGAATTCNGSIVTGALPWKDMGLSRDDVVDAYGDYYTYVVSADAKTLCDQITNSYDATVEVTGKLATFTDLKLSTPIGDRYVPFAIISHGKNQRGALSKNSSTITATPSNSHEAANIHGGTPSTIYGDAYNGTSDSTYFDDQVYAPSQSDAEKICKSLTPGKKLNAAIADNFDGTTSATPNATTYATSASNPPTIVTAANSTNNKVASFSNGNSYLASNAGTYNFAPSVRPVYVSVKWTPDPSSAGATDAGMSIATRATTSDLNPGTDDFSLGSARGITFRFYKTTSTNDISAGGVDNNIYVKDNGSVSATSTGTYKLIRGKTYLLEAYDDGTNLWGRITQTDNTSNTAYVELAGNSNDHTGSQQVVFINGNSLSYLDEILIGYPMLAAETDGSNDIIYSAAGTNGWTGSAPHNLTLEAWVRVKAAPSAKGVIISKWDANGATSATNQAYRLYLDSSRLLNLDIAGSVSGTVVTRSYSLGITPKLDTWVHIAVVYNASSQTIRAYQDDELATSVATDIDTSTGANDNNARPFSVGAEFNGGSGGTVVDGLNADFSDIRVWNAAQTDTVPNDLIRPCYEIRIPTTACPSTNLIVNWKLDPGYNGLGSTTAAASPSGSAGTLTNGAFYVGALAVYYRPFSKDFCPTGTYSGTYQCDIRVATANGASGATKTLTVPSNLSAIYTKVWGAGGGAYSSTNSSPGGSAGFSEGLIQSLGGTTVAGMNLTVYVGGYGAGSTAPTIGGGGGAGSGIFTNLGVAGVAAGGGGGASYSADSAVGNCNTVTNGTSQCGTGGGGGGYESSATMSRAADGGAAVCGGRPGDSASFGNDPPHSTGSACGGAGDDPKDDATTTGTTTWVGGGPSSGGSLGGLPTILAGGRGTDSGSASSPFEIGSGGGGGGVAMASGTCSNSPAVTTPTGGGEAGGYNNSSGSPATTHYGYGGGGGAGCADSGVANRSGGNGGASTSGACSGTSNVTTTKNSYVVSVSTSLGSLGWYVGCTMTENSGGNFPASLSITARDTTNNTVTLNHKANGAGTSNLTSSGSATSTLGSSPGGSGDFYYTPSYVDFTNTYSPPGVGGSSGSVNGTAGAVVLLW